MYYSDFKKICESQSVKKIVCDDINEGFKIFFDNTEVNVSIGEDWDENQYGDVDTWSCFKFKTDEEIRIEEENSIPICDESGKLSKEYLEFSAKQIEKLKEKYSDENFKATMDWLTNNNGL